MARCKRVFGLGMGYVQAILLALPYSVDNLMWYIVLEIIEGKHKSQREVENMKENMINDAVENIRSLRAVLTGMGRIASMFVIQKINAKFLLLGVTAAEVIFLLFAHSLYLAYGRRALAWSYLAVILIQGSRFSFSMNILAKWTITRRMTSVYCTFEVTKALILSFMMLVVRYFTIKGNNPVLVYVYTTIAWKTSFCILWPIFGAADPLQSLFVSLEELDELRKGNPRRIKTRLKNTVPWRKIFVTPILYGCIIYDIGNMWVHDWEWSSLIDPLTIYLDRGLVVALVGFYGFLLTCLIAAFVVDYIIKLGITTVNNIRKTAAAITSWGTGVCFLLIGYTLTDKANPVWVTFYQIFRTANFYNDSALIVYALSSNYFGFNYAFVSSIAYLSMGLKNRVDAALAHKGMQWVLYFYGMLNMFSCLTMLVSGDCHPREFDSFGTIEWKDESFVSFP